MSEKKVTTIYEEILGLLKVVIERDFQPCHLEEALKTVLYELATKAVKEAWSGWMIIVSGVFWAVELARFLAEKYDKELCHYLNMALKREWIENWVLGFRELK